MTKQIYDVQRSDDKIEIIKNDIVIYTIKVEDKTINLLQLYENMSIQKDDSIFVKQDLIPIPDPKNDSERIYNNTIDFFNKLLVAINIKLKELNTNTDNNVFG